MKKKNLILLSVLIIISFLPKVISIILNGKSPYDFNLYTLSAFISYIMYIYIFIKIYKFITTEDNNANNLLKALYNTSLLLFCNSLLIVMNELIKTLYFYKSVLNDSSYIDFFNFVSMSVFTETGAFGYMTISLSFFLIICIYKSKVNSEL